MNHCSHHATRGATADAGRRCRKPLYILHLCVGLFIGSTAVAELPREVFARMPGTTAVAIALDEPKQMLEHLRQTGPGRMFSSGLFDPFREALQQRNIELVSWGDRFPLPWTESSEQLDSDGFGIAVVETDDGLPELCFVVDMGASQNAWLAWVENFVSESSRQGAAAEQKDLSGSTLWVVPRQPRPAAILHSGQWLILGKTESCLRQWADLQKPNDQPEQTAHLTEDERYLNTIGRLEERYQAYGDAWFFVDPLRLDHLIDRLRGEEVGAFSESFAVRHGFDAIRACGGLVALGGPQHDARYRLRVWTPRPHGKGMQLLRWGPLKDPRPSPWVPKNVSSYSVASWDLQPILGNIGPIVDEVISEITGASNATFNAFLEQVRSSDGPGVDLEKELMPLLGPRIEYVSLFTPPVSTTAEQSIVAVEVSDDAELADLLSLLLEADNAVPLTVPGFPFALWKLGRGRRAGESGPSLNIPGVMVAHGKLFLASSYVSLRQHVAVEPPSAALADDAEFVALEASIASVAGDKPAIRTIAFPARDFYNSYELIRTGRTKEAESIYLRLLSRLLEENIEKLPFELLPPFQSIQSAFGPACIQVNVEDDGWDLWGMNLRSTSSPETSTP